MMLVAGLGWGRRCLLLWLRLYRRRRLLGLFTCRIRVLTCLFSLVARGGELHLRLPCEPRIHRLQPRGGQLLASAVHCPDAFDVFLGHDPMEGMLHAQEGRNVAHEGHAVIDRCRPERCAPLHLPHLGEKDPVLGLGQINPIFRCDVDIIVADIAVAPAGFRRNRDDMPDHPWNGKIRQDAGQRHFSS